MPFSKVAAVVVALLVLAGCDWQMRLGGIDHTSTTRDSGLTASAATSLVPKWRATDVGCQGSGADAGFFATPVTFNHVVYIGGLSGCLYALNESDGTPRWSRFMGFQPQLTCTSHGLIASANVQSSGNGPVVYVHAPDGYLYKLDGTNGAVIWRSVVQIPSTTASDVYAWSSPTVANGRVIVGVSSACGKPYVQGQVRAYDAATGNLLWVHNTIPDGYVGASDWHDAAVDGNGDVYVSTGSVDPSVGSAHPNTADGFEENSILKLSGSTGSLIWKAPAPDSSDDLDYGSSPILFSANSVDLVGATNKDGIFRVYRRDNGTEVWEAQIGTSTLNGSFGAFAGGVFDGTHLFVMSNATTTGGVWGQHAGGTWSDVGGSASPGSIRALDPATGDLAQIGGQPFELPLPSNVMGPCSLNANALLVCAGAHWFSPLTDHDNGLFVVDTTKPPAVLAHLEDSANYAEFGQPVQENGAILAANTDDVVKWAAP